MQNIRKMNNQELRNLVLAGEMLAMALESKEAHDKETCAQFIAVWRAAIVHLRESGMFGNQEEQS